MKWGFVIAFAVLAASCGGNSDEAQRAAKEQAERVAKQAVQEAQAAQDRVDQLAREIREQDQQLADAEAAVRNAQTDEERKAAQLKLDKLRQQRIEIEKRIHKEKLAADKSERAKGVHLSKECLENPLAKGCS
jgi:hypothetical protein